MKKIIRICLAIVAVVLLLTVSSYPVGAEEISVDDLYGRNVLKTMSNAEVLLKIYDSIAQGIENSVESIEIPCGNAISINSGEDLSNLVAPIYEAYANDYPQHFWVDDSYELSANVVSGNLTVIVKPAYIYSGAELSAKKAELNGKVNSILSNINKNWTDLEKETYIHDYLVANIKYDMLADNMHNVYGALIGGKCVCDGYAESFQLLMNKIGIPAVRVTGIATNASGNPENHAWNIVRIDGNDYEMDVTWDDSDTDFIMHGYMNLTTNEISLDHSRKVTSIQNAYPVCTATAKNYLKCNVTEITEFNVADVAKAFNNENLTSSVYINGNVSDFRNWMSVSGNHSAVLTAVLGGSYSYQVRFTTCRNEVMIEYQLTDVDKPVIVNEPKGGSIRCGKGASFYVNVTGQGISFQWYYNDGTKITDDSNVTGSSGQMITFGSLENDISVYCVVKNIAGSVASKRAEMKIVHEKASNQYMFDENNHYRMCKWCNEPYDVTPHTGGTPNCTYKATCSVCSCSYGELNPEKHASVTLVNSVAPTDTEDGYTGDTVCNACGETISVGSVIQSTSHIHNMMKVSSKEPTCEEDGNIDYWQCTKCLVAYTDQNGVNMIALDETVRKAKGHTEATDNAVQPTCAATGLTEGKHCSVCGKVITKQDIIPKTEHMAGEWVVVKPAEIGVAGIKEQRCTVCGDLLDQSAVEALQEPIDEGKKDDNKEQNKPDDKDSSSSSKTEFGIKGCASLSVSSVIVMLVGITSFATAIKFNKIK